MNPAHLRSRDVNETLAMPLPAALAPARDTFEELYRSSRDDVYAYVATLLRGNTLINHQQKSGRHHLKEGDLLEVGGLMLEFRLKG